MDLWLHWLIVLLIPRHVGLWIATWCLLGGVRNLPIALRHLWLRCLWHGPRGLARRRAPLSVLLGPGGDGHHRSTGDVVLYGEAAALVGHVLLHVRKARPHTTDVVLHLLGCRGGAVLHGQVLLLDSWSLVREAQRVALIEDRNGGCDEIGVDEVFDNLANHGEGNLTSLLVREAVDGCRDFLEVAADVRGLDDHHARRRCRVVVDGNACGIAHGPKVTLGVTAAILGALWGLLVPLARILGRIVDEWIERVVHPALPLDSFHQL